MSAPALAPTIFLPRLPRTEAQDQIISDADARERALSLQVRRIADASVDAIAHTNASGFIVKPVPTFDGETLTEDSPHFYNGVILQAGTDGPALALSKTAHHQLAEKTGIPVPYYKRMLAKDRALLAENVNRWFQREPEKRLIRALKPLTDEQGRALHAIGAQMTVRAVLGATYRPLDNSKLLDALLPVLQARGVRLAGFHLDDQRLHARWVGMDRNVRDGVTLAEQGFIVGEMVRAGMSLRNSETGFASLDVSGFIEIIKCLNGLIVPAQVKMRHVGGKRGREQDTVEWLSEATQHLDNAAIFSRVRDAAEATLADSAFTTAARKIISAKATLIEQPQDVPQVKWIQNLGAALELTEAETDLLTAETFKSVAEEGGFTKFAVSQGITATARQLPDFDKRVELENAGWNVLDGDVAVKLAATARSARDN